MVLDGKDEVSRPMVGRAGSDEHVCVLSVGQAGKFFY